MYSYAEKLTTPHWPWWLWRQLVGLLLSHLYPQTNPIPSQLLPLPVIQKCPTWYSQTKFLGIVPYFQYHILIRLTHLQIAPQTMAPSPLPLLAPSYLFNTILVCSWSFTHPVPHLNQSIRVTLDNYPSSLPSPKLQATMMTITTNFPITILLNQKSYLSVSSFTNHPNTTIINNQIYHCFHSTDPTLTLQTCITAQAQILRKILQYNHTTQHTSFIQYIAGPIADQPKKTDASFTVTLTINLHFISFTILMSLSAMCSQHLLSMHTQKMQVSKYSNSRSSVFDIMIQQHGLWHSPNTIQLAFHHS